MTPLDAINYEKLREADKHLFYTACYGSFLYQHRIDEEGAGTVFGSLVEFPLPRFDLYKIVADEGRRPQG